MKNSITTVAVIILCLVSHFVIAQVTPDKKMKLPVYGKIGLGFGQTLFFGDMKSQLTNSYGSSFNPGIGNNLMMGFYIALENWKGLRVG